MWLLGAVKRIIEASIWDELKDQHWNFRLQAASDETDQVGMPNLELEGDLVDELIPRPGFLVIYYGSFNCN